MPLNFKDTGIPRGRKIEYATAPGNHPNSSSSGFPGKSVYITSIMNSTAVDSYVSRQGAQIKAPAGSAVSYKIPLGPFPSFYISSSHYPTDGVAVLYITVDND